MAKAPFRKSAAGADGARYNAVVGIVSPVAPQQIRGVSHARELADR
jgi:hypothetical protein